MAEYHLVVSESFDGFARGEHITDPALIAAIRADHRASQVRQIIAPPTDPNAQ